MTTSKTIDIIGLGSQGDGLPATPGHDPVPFTLPGETIRLRGEGRYLQDIDILTPSPHRVSPPCPYFGTCGGCRLQHLSPALYASFKRDKVLGALQKAGVSGECVAPLLSLAVSKRRRASLKFRVEKGRAFLGFFERGSHRLCAIDTCLVLEPALNALLDPLRTFLQKALPAPTQGEVLLLQSDGGVDVALKTKHPLGMDLAFLEAVGELVQENALARFSCNGEEVLVRTPPYVTFEGVKVPAAADGFLQVSPAAEEAMIGLIRSQVAAQFSTESLRVADLFAGRGLFTFAFREVAATLHAYEMDPKALRAFEKAAAPFPSIKIHRRNLFSTPLAATELNAFDLVILDPPREGAVAQSRALAAATVPLLCYVSCKPETFARDAKILTAGGYALDKVYPIDQFEGSQHVELVAFFTPSETGLHPS